LFILLAHRAQAAVHNIYQGTAHPHQIAAPAVHHIPHNANGAAKTPASSHASFSFWATVKFGLVASLYISAIEPHAEIRFHTGHKYLDQAFNVHHK